MNSQMNNQQYRAADEMWEFRRLFPQYTMSLKALVG